MMRWHLALAAGLAAVAVHGCETTPTRGQPATREVAVERYQKAMKYIREQNIDMALVTIQSAISADPSAAIYHHVYANLLAQKHQYVQAELEYRAAIQRDPMYDPSWEGLVQVVRAQGDKEKVAVVLRDRVRISPLDAGWRLRLGKAYEATGNLMGAERELRAAADLGKGEQAAYAHVRLGLVYEALGRPGAAVREYEESLKLNPDQPQVRAILDQLEAPPKP